jgi:hypothetical protein
MRRTTSFFKIISELSKPLQTSKLIWRVYDFRNTAKYLSEFTALTSQERVKCEFGAIRSLTLEKNIVFIVK